ncbi:hypothetical protein IT072_08755 [Leifsonia sp. ZF2019]|uniref:hypothetical protein n=1 Tax=Leifsonia sp. ZF2019 TaxID=2781978 RepID=UPI001CBCF170|nr:hypothetical protein [Leifsonia sp. ZF2019]UAJ81058.1 hypothetical protein IT072_08755 [Leifsonia sp. ZF2019]
MTGPAVVFAGVAHSHPFADAANLRDRGARIAGVWDADDGQRRDGFSARFAAEPHATLEGLLDTGPDLVIATPRTPRAPAVVAACAAAGVPVFVNKTIAATEEALASLDAAAAAGARFGTSSVLRFAPAVAAFAALLDGSRVRAVDVTAQHDIAGFLTPERAWQDDPASGGGTLLSIGVHAVDLVDAVLPLDRGRAVLEGAIVVDARGSAGAVPTRSEAVAVVRADTAEGIPLTLTISGVPGPDRYALRVVTDGGLLELALGDGDDLGYAGLADALLATTRGASLPAPWRRSAAGYRLLLDAAVTIRTRREVAA